MSAENHIDDNDDNEDNENCDDTEDYEDMPDLEPSENYDNDDNDIDNDSEDNDDDIIDNYDSEEDYEHIMKMQNTLCQLFDIVKKMDEKGECYGCYFAGGISAKSCNKTWACIERRITSCIKNKESTSDTDQPTFIDLLDVECRTFFFAEKFDLVDLCIEHGVDIINMKFNDETLLHNSIYRGNIKQVKYLISKNCDVTTVNNRGETPLHVVFCNYRPTALNFAKLLLDAGAVIYSKDKNGETPFDKACKYKNMFPCVYELFLDHKH